MILLDSYYDFEENEVLFVKIGTSVPDLWLDMSFGSKLPKTSFRSQTPNVTVLGSKSFLISSSMKYCIRQALIFKFWVIFDKVMSVYSQKIAK